MTANGSKSYLRDLNKLADEYNNGCHHSIDTKPVNAEYSALTKDIEESHKIPKFKFGDWVRRTKYKNIISKGYTINWSREIFVIDSVWKTNPWMYKMKDLNREKIIGIFNELLLSKLSISYYPEPVSYITDKVKVILVLSNYAIKKEL